LHTCNTISKSCGRTQNAETATTIMAGCDTDAKDDGDIPLTRL
jgi:hypothetical protein